MPVPPSTPPLRRWPRGARLAAWGAGVLAAVLALAVLFILTFDWNRARPWLNARVSEALQRPFAIRGDLRVHWAAPAATLPPAARTWRDHIPWPHLVAQDVHLGNPSTLPGELASVRQLGFSLSPLALLQHRIAIPILRLDAPRVMLLRQDAARYNWAFPRKQAPSRWTLALERVVLAKGVVTLDDALTDAHLVADVDTRDDPRYGIVWKVRGNYRGAPVGGGGQAGAVLSLQQQNAPYPVQAELHSGASRIAVEGTVTRPAQLAALDLRLQLAAPSMARLYNFTGITLPETPAFSTEGRLIGAIGERGSRWTYDRFQGKVGASDIAGRLTYESGSPRPRLSGNVVSRQLRFADLGPLIGADSNASKAARGVAAVQPAGKVLPVERFRTERWSAIDADVRFAAERVLRQEALPITGVSTHIVMRNGVITLDPLNFGIAGGQLQSSLRLDGSQAGPIRATAQVGARRLQIKQLFPAIQKVQQASVGEVNGEAKLSAVGDSVASLLASSNGEVKALVNQGTISKLLLEEMGLNVGNIVVTKLFGDRPVRLNCLAAGFGVTDGLMQTQMFVVDTDEAVIKVDGSVNLATERLDLTLHPQTKGLRVFSLRSPLYVRGPFKQPAVAVDKGTLAMKAGGAAVLALAAPAAALLPLINTGPGEDSDCGRLLAQARQAPTAPPPGRSRR